MWKSTFSWHVEDMDLYAINVVHSGAPKTWYCVPPEHGHKLEKLCSKLFPAIAAHCTNFMRHKSCLLSPAIMDKHHIPYHRMIQEAREIIVVFPYAYHSGFNHGFNIAESTNFATERWVEYGKRHRPCDCDHTRRVKFSMDPFVKKFQPDKYAAWQSHLDVAPHPEDPPDVVNDILKRAANPKRYAHERELKALKNFRQDQTDPNMKPIDVYRHIDLKRLEVEVDPETFKLGRGKLLIEEFFQKDNLDVKQLIDHGVLYKISQVMLEQRPRSSDHSAAVERKPSTTVIEENVITTVYKHVSNPDIVISVDHDTFELHSAFSDEAAVFLDKYAEMTIKDLVRHGVFLKVCDQIVKLKKRKLVSNPEPDDIDPGPLKKSKCENSNIVKKHSVQINAAGPCRLVLQSA